MVSDGLPAPGLQILSVGAAARAIAATIRADEQLRDLWVEGEVGRVTISSAGHAYFALKDERNQLQCVWFRDDRERSAFEAQAGLRVVVHGRIDLYEPTGALQLYVDTMQPAGFGDLADDAEDSASDAKVSSSGCSVQRHAGSGGVTLPATVLLLGALLRVRRRASSRRRV